MKKRLDPELPDIHNPEWSQQQMARAQPASQVLPELFGTQAAKAMLKPRGRPHADVVKDRITIRLSPDVLRLSEPAATAGRRGLMQR